MSFVYEIISVKQQGRVAISMQQQFKSACAPAKTDPRSQFLHLKFPNSIDCIRDRKTL